MADGDGILSDIGGVLGDIGSVVVDEAKKFGKSATGQVTGSSVDPQSDKSSTKATTSDPGGDSVLKELKKFGQSVTSQISGSEVSPQLASMQKKDKEFSNVEAAKIRAKIKSMYAQYDTQKSREKKQIEMVEERKEEQQTLQKEQVKKQEMANSAVQKTRAEIKNYGAE